MNNTPKLRFPEFNDQWNEKKLGEIFSITAGGDIKSENVNFQKNEIFKYPIYANAEKNDGLYGYSNIYKIDKNCITVAGRGVNLGIAHARDFKFYPIVRLLILLPKIEQSIYFFEYAINLISFNIESTGVPQLTAPQIKNYKLYFPTLPEQQKIAEFLTAVDKQIDNLKLIIDNLKKYKKAVMQKIFAVKEQDLTTFKKLSNLISNRFKDENGNDFPEWEEKTFNEIFISISTKKHQIKNIEILETGKHFVVDQGQSKIAGYSNDNEKLFKNIPIIIFGDHTTILKYIDFEFIVGADGTKILKNKIGNLLYLYYYLTFNNINSEGYKRHFSILNEIIIKFPCLSEQQKIADFLSSIDERIGNYELRITNCKTWKKGLLQEMFV